MINRQVPAEIVVAEAGNLRGIACMLLAGFFLNANDSITKYLVPHYPVGEILLVQALLIAVISMVWLLQQGEHPFRWHNPKFHLIRGCFYAGGSFAFVYALHFLPLAEVIAIAFAGPLFMSIFGRIFLGEVIGPHRLTGIVIGFMGVLIVIQPGTSAMHWAAILPLTVAILDGLRDTMTRHMTVRESSRKIVFSTAVVLALAASLTYGEDWKAVELQHLAWFVLSASSFVIAHYFLVEAFRHARIAAVAPFKYIQLLWGILAGIVFFGETPGLVVFTGIGVILASGFYVAWREALRS